MAQKEIVTIFCGIGINDNVFWLGAIEKGDKINGMINNSNAGLYFSANMDSYSMRSW